MRHKLVLLMFSIFLLFLPAALAQEVQGVQEITEVSLEMFPGIPYPQRSYKIVITQEGIAKYHGKVGVKLLGKYKGTVTREEFDKLANLIRVNKFFDMKSILSSTATTSSLGNYAPAIGSTSVVSNGKRKTVERPIAIKVNNPDTAPKELREIEDAIYGLAMTIKWAKEGK